MKKHFTDLRCCNTVFTFLISTCIYHSGAQPVLSTRQTIEGYSVFKDFSNAQLYYYDPPDVILKKDDNGSPAFKLLQMRYTGTHLYSDQNFKGYLNILQLSIELQPILPAIYDQLKKMLGANAILKPLPIRKFYGELIIPLGDAAAANEKYRKISMSGVEASGESSAGNSFWSERTFTIQLQNDEAQLLWDQEETGKLGISFSYSFYAEAMPGTIGNVIASGNGKDFKEGIGDVPEETVFDNKINTYLVKANAFPIYINVSQFPDCLKKIDINEELPPAYASFEVRCYDFSDDLRPDLFKKIVEIKAYGAAKQYITIKADFNRNKSDISSINARFPYAILLDHPLEYRTLEINVDGETITSPWMTKENWTEVIDVTTPVKENTIGKKVLEFELDPDTLLSTGIQKANCEIHYHLNGKELIQLLNWTAGEGQGLQSLEIRYDLKEPIRYNIIFERSGTGKITSGYKIIGKNDNYIFIPVLNQ